MSNKTSDKNGGNIEDDIKKYVKRCEELAKPEHANWIGISNQLAILHMLEDYKMQKQINEEHQKINGELREKVKELDTKNDELLKDLYSANCIIADLTDSIPKQKVINEINNLKKMFKATTEGILQEYTVGEIIIKTNTLQELLEGEE